jgi:subtilisin family serine protease
MVATVRRIRPSLLALAALAALALAAPAWAGAVPGLRVMLHPGAASRGTLPEAMHARLERIAGTTLTLTGTTRTGALELATPGPVDDATAARLAKALREDRAVLWAEPQRAARPVTKAANKDARYNRLGRQLMVRLADGVAEDWSTLAPRFAELVGMPVAAERKVGNVWLLSGRERAHARRARRSREVARAGRRRDVRGPGAPHVSAVHAERSAVPGPVVAAGPAVGRQRAGGVGRAAGLGGPRDRRSSTPASSTIRISPGACSRATTSCPIRRARATATGAIRIRATKATGTSAGDCGDGFPAFDSFFHGLFVAGLIAANPDNGIGIAGVDFNAKILPVRALARCGGTDADIFEGMLWASGVPIAGIPPNPNPARIINLSLGGFGACSGAIQEAVDDAIAQGSIVVVSAGNESSDALDFAPSNCSGVITVGASNLVGDRTSYSNYGTRIDLSAPGGDAGGVSSLILSTYVEGVTAPGAPTYAIAAGTSFAAPLVTGTVSLMLARNSLLTSGRVLSILQGTSRAFPYGTTCGAGTVCGAGLLDAGAALAATLPATAVIPPNAVPIIEYYRPDIDHYFITADVNEVAYIDTFLRGVFQRTGIVFFGYLDAFLAPPGVRPVCRFYAGGLINSHFFTASRARVPVRAAALGRHLVPRDAGGVLHRGARRRRALPRRHDPGLPLLRQPAGREPPPHARPVGEARDDQSRWVPEGVNGVAFCSPV